MKEILFYLTVLLVFIFGSINGQTEAFEGFVKYQVNMNNGDSKNPSNLEMEFYLKKDSVRVEFDAPNRKLVILFQNENAFMLVTSNKMYVKLPLDIDSSKLEEHYQAMLMSKTEHKKTIFGYECNLYVQAEGDEVVELWCSDIEGVKFSLPRLSERQFNRIPFPEGVLPLEIRITNKQGIEKGSFILKEIEEKELADSLFEIPADYTLMGE